MYLYQSPYSYTTSFKPLDPHNPVNAHIFPILLVTFNF